MERGIFDIKGKNLNPLNNEPYSDTYKILAKKWSEYPAYEKSLEILQSIKKYQITFIISGTGSGKTVLVPKFALHYLDYKGKIIVTLPKKKATVSAATFSAKTLDVKLGKEIGYQYKNSPKNMLNDSNKIIYMTDGLLMVRFLRDPLLTDFQIIIIDEVHERNVRIDLLLLFLKNLLESGKRPDLRVIIMSATIDVDKYKKYFSGIDNNAIHISGQPNYPIEVIFLEEPIKSYLQYGYKLISQLIKDQTKDAILFFIVTSNEAFNLCYKIRQDHKQVYCIELYADIPDDLKIYAEDKDKFLELGNYDQKVIMATNVAESSITIDGLKYVIDSAYELYTYFSPDYYGKMFVKKLITKAQALQRRGRVGRTEPGICYHLITKLQYDLLDDYPTPDILRQDITGPLLSIITLTREKTFQSGYDMLSKLMDVPREDYITCAYKLYTTYDLIDDTDKITDLGLKVSKLNSLELNKALFLIYSYQFGCAKQASIILAMIDILKGNLENLFYKSDVICDAKCTEKSLKLIKQLLDPTGDHLTFLNIFQTYKKIPETKAWIRKHNIRLDKLQAAEKIAEHYYHHIINIHKDNRQNRIENIEKKEDIIKALINSHKHLEAEKMKSIFNKSVMGKISKESVIYYLYDIKALANRKFIYDELVNINNIWEFHTVTLI